MNYSVSVPIIDQEWLEPEKVFREAQRCNAMRIILAIGLKDLTVDRLPALLERLRKHLAFFRANGLETGIWLWTFWRTEGAPGTRMANSAGQERGAFYCPLSPEYTAYSADLIGKLAVLKPDLILFDDDFRFSFLDGGGTGCWCDLHIADTARRLGEPITRESLRKSVLSGGKNRYRTAWLRSLGESLERFAAAMRAAVDAVDPTIRLGVCSAMSLWDADGTDPLTIARLLAGNTRPLLRLIGAPYWAVKRSWGNRLQDVIELERMEYAWCGETSAEILTEGDAFPRPRTNCPARYLECFDTALRAAGVGSGIFKYGLDYLASPAMETGYIDRHVKNTEARRAIARQFTGKPIGVRVYETQKKAECAVLGGGEEEMRDLFFSHAARVLSANSIPTVYEGGGITGIVFGENARALPKSALEHGLFLDLPAAQILAERGVDVGLEAVENAACPDVIYYPDQQERQSSYYNSDAFHVIRPKPGVKALSFADNYPDTYFYKNTLGQRFCVFCFNGGTVHERRYRHPCFQRMLLDTIPLLSGEELPVLCAGNPDAYLLIRRNRSGLALGIWNLFADEIPPQSLRLTQPFRSVTPLWGSAVLKGDQLEIGEIQPFSFALYQLND